MKEMKDFTGLTLCNWHGDRVEVHVRADMTDGALTFSGQDLGPYVEQVWGDSDYEYWYSLDRENTGKLLSAIHGEQDPQAALLREFSGEGGCRKLRQTCEGNGIRYNFHSYA